MIAPNTVYDARCCKFYAIELSLLGEVIMVILLLNFG